MTNLPENARLRAARNIGMLTTASKALGSFGTNLENSCENISLFLEITTGLDHLLQLQKHRRLGGKL